MNFTDLYGNLIQLSEDSEEHIRQAHPEVSNEAIASTLKAPDEIRQSRLGDHVLLYYRRKEALKEKTRFWQVVIKTTSEGRYISTAMTTSSIKKGSRVYQRKGET